jgi:hypothetical protein
VRGVREGESGGESGGRGGRKDDGWEREERGDEGWWRGRGYIILWVTIASE